MINKIYVCTWGGCASKYFCRSLSNMNDDFKIYNRIYAEYFKDNQPCRTTLEICSLPTPIAIELKCIAII